MFGTSLNDDDQLKFYLLIKSGEENEFGLLLLITIGNEMYDNQDECLKI